MFDFRRESPNVDESGIGRPNADRGKASGEDPYLTLARLPLPEQTLEMIKRHEALQQRGRPPFSVVVMVVGLPGDDPGPAMRVLRVYRKRARVSDEIGWIAADRMALILPLTPRAGALRLAEEIAARAGLGGEPPEFTVFTS